MVAIAAYGGCSGTNGSASEEADYHAHTRQMRQLVFFLLKSYASSQQKFLFFFLRCLKKKGILIFDN